MQHHTPDNPLVAIDSDERLAAPRGEQRPVEGVERPARDRADLLVLPLAHGP